MPTLVLQEVRLDLLNQAQPNRPWRSSTEKRRCVVCDKVFRGNDVLVREETAGGNRLACPTCHSAPALWVRLGNPLIDNAIWADWEAALDFAALDPGENFETGLTTAG